MLRAELTHRFGVGWRPIVNGQAEIAGVRDELLAVFSKRTAVIDHALDVKIDEFRAREGRDPSRWERAAMTREASADTRSRKSGHGATDLVATLAHGGRQHRLDRRAGRDRDHRGRHPDGCVGRGCGWRM